MQQLKTGDGCNWLASFPKTNKIKKNGPCAYNRKRYQETERAESMVHQIKYLAVFLSGSGFKSIIFVRLSLSSFRGLNKIKAPIEQWGPCVRLPSPPPLSSNTWSFMLSSEPTGSLAQRAKKIGGIFPGSLRLQFKSCRNQLWLSILSRLIE